MTENSPLRGRLTGFSDGTTWYLSAPELFSTMVIWNAIHPFELTTFRVQPPIGWGVRGSRLKVSLGASLVTHAAMLDGPSHLYLIWSFHYGNVRLVLEIRGRRGPEQNERKTLVRWRWCLPWPVTLAIAVPLITGVYWFDQITLLCTSSGPNYIISWFLMVVAESEQCEERWKPCWLLKDTMWGLFDI